MEGVIVEARSASGWGQGDMGSRGEEIGRGPSPMLARLYGPRVRAHSKFISIRKDIDPYTAVCTDLVQTRDEQRGEITYCGEEWRSEMSGEGSSGGPMNCLLKSRAHSKDGRGYSKEESAS